MRSVLLTQSLYKTKCCGTK